MSASTDWNIGKMLEWMTGYLENHSDPDPVVSSRWLISDATGLSMMGLYTNLDRPLSPDELDTLRENVKKRAEGTPLQYITGKTAFRFIDIKIKPGILIPRPETEVLVSEVLARLPRDKFASSDESPETDILVCDLCTGSGCVAVSLAHENPRLKVIATDISSGCVSLAKENTNDLDLDDRVEIIECDLAEGIDSSYIGTIDAIVSNPPYIPTDDLEKLPAEVEDFEPTLALDGGKDGLDVFRRISAWAIPALKQDGFLACELHEDTLDDAAKIALDDGFTSTEIVKDLGGRPRVLIAYKGEHKSPFEVDNEFDEEV